MRKCVCESVHEFVRVGMPKFVQKTQIRDEWWFNAEIQLNGGGSSIDSGDRMRCSRRNRDNRGEGVQMSNWNRRKVHQIHCVREKTSGCPRPGTQTIQSQSLTAEESVG